MSAHDEPLTGGNPTTMNPGPSTRALLLGLTSRQILGSKYSRRVSRCSQVTPGNRTPSQVDEAVKEDQVWLVFEYICLLVNTLKTQ